jgi:hypothetical protein
MQFYELLPTPVVVDNPHPNSKVNEQGRRYNNKEESSHSMGLSDLAHHEMLPTPAARDWKGKTNPGVVKEGSGCIYGETLPDTVDRLTKSQDANDGKTSRLSPLFTEEMMGFPLMWTALPFLSENGEPKPSKPTATPSSPK